MLDDTLFNGKTKLNWYEKGEGDRIKSIMKCHAIDIDKQENDPYLYPAKMSDKLLAKIPPVVLTTTEFDIYLKEVTKFKNRLIKVGKLLDSTVNPDADHTNPTKNKSEEDYEPNII